jgi:hypothetical protein
MPDDVFNWLDNKQRLPQPRPMSPYDVGVDMANNEFTVDMQPYLDNVAQLGYDPTKTKLMAPGLNIKGQYIPPRWTEEQLDYYNQRFNNFSAYDEPFKPDYTYVSPDVIGDGGYYAHEYRHRGYDRIKGYLNTLSEKDKDTLAKEIKTRGMEEYSAKDLRSAIDKISNKSRKLEEMWVRYMDVKGRIVKNSDDEKYIDDVYVTQKLIEPVVASHIARMLSEKEIEEGLKAGKK